MSSNGTRVYFDGGPLDGRTETPSAFMTRRAAASAITSYQWTAARHTDQLGEAQVWTCVADTHPAPSETTS